ncbi:thiamine pyrophosphate-binding protein [Verticiella sediminum]|uniref:Thiamine pyrophosphate-binding protein n=1 Tax=Verticiella sediminum TaxID=1247510 RepID=A0A556A9I5_9BURK|nr:thiamine pyrophosphate-binding protein [Verticiella sediminum]TSH89547.1 thiamine pyrophosphate-binding protein [Verticiella sediminum]
MNIGDMVAKFLKAANVDTVFAIISVHNIPIMDGIAREGGIKVVMTRGEMGASHMADGYARIAGKLGVLISSTGPGAANAVSGLLEASYAGTPVLHITGQVPSPYIGRDTGTTHGVKDQLGMLRSVCKAAYRVNTPQEAWGILTKAATEAMTAPTGPVSVEIPIDIQKAMCPEPPVALVDLRAVRPRRPAADVLAKLAERVAGARRPMFWVGSGAKDCGPLLARFLELGFGMVTSWAGRGIVTEAHPMNLGALNGSGSKDVEDFYQDVDLMIVLGSRLRGQETVDQSVKLPAHRVQVDIDPAAEGRTYTVDLFVQGDCATVLEALLAEVGRRVQVDADFPGAFAAMKQRARSNYKKALGPYAQFAETLRAEAPDDSLWIRDITVANSTWGHRLYEMYQPRHAAHPVGAGIGQGLPLAIGAAFAAPGRQTILLSGDAGFVMNVCELWTAKQEGLDLLMVVMNDAGYGVIKHMQDAAFGGRRVYGDLAPPDFGQLARCVGAAYTKVGAKEAFGHALRDAMPLRGLRLLEVDMGAIGEAPPYHPFLKLEKNDDARLS